jgi:hypothetical protein
MIVFNKEETCSKDINNKSRIDIETIFWRVDMPLEYRNNFLVIETTFSIIDG